MCGEADQLGDAGLRSHDDLGSGATGELRPRAGRAARGDRLPGRACHVTQRREARRQGAAPTGEQGADGRRDIEDGDRVGAKVGPHRVGEHPVHLEHRRVRGGDALHEIERRALRQHGRRQDEHHGARAVQWPTD
jgi:hypothetical protein